jgi:hypothetical protein
MEQNPFAKIQARALAHSAARLPAALLALLWAILGQEPLLGAR